MTRRYYRSPRAGGLRSSIDARRGRPCSRRPTRATAAVAGWSAAFVDAGRPAGGGRARSPRYAASAAPRTSSWWPTSTPTTRASRPTHDGAGASGSRRCSPSSSRRRTVDRVVFAVAEPGARARDVRRRHLHLPAQPTAGMAEDELLRGAAPDDGRAPAALAARQLRRSSGCRRAEDVYLFHGVARDEPQGRAALRPRRGARPDAGPRRAAGGRRAAGVRAHAGRGARGDPPASRPTASRAGARSGTGCCSTCGR